MRRLAEAGLVDEAGTAVAPDLFWELAAAWRTERTWLLRRPDPKQHVPSDPLAPSWRMTGTAAAAAYGAPLASAGEGPLELYVTGPVELSIAVASLRRRSARCRLRRHRRPADVIGDGTQRRRCHAR